MEELDMYEDDDGFDLPDNVEVEAVFARESNFWRSSRDVVISLAKSRGIEESDLPEVFRKRVGVILDSMSGEFGQLEKRPYYMISSVEQAWARIPGADLCRGDLQVYRKQLSQKRSFIRGLLALL